MAQTAGVKPMQIAGRTVEERERCIGMSDAERAWRKKWLKDQILSCNEPVYVEEYWRERINPIRRAYRAPLNILFKALTPVLGEPRATHYRYIAGKLCMMALGAMSLMYYAKYNGNDWTRKGGWRVVRSKPTTLPGQQCYPFKSPKKCNDDYADREYKSSIHYIK